VKFWQCPGLNFQKPGKEALWHTILTGRTNTLTMKKPLFIFLLFAISCAPTTMITGSWKNPNGKPKTYNTIFVAALTGNTVGRSVTENDFATNLSKHGVQALKSLDEFPPNFLKDSIPKKEMLDKINKKNVDAILTISLLKRSSESRYVPGNYMYAPMTRFGYYGTFGGYYSYWYPYSYSPGYYTEEDIYYLETNLYDSSDESLLWSAQSKTYAYGSLSAVSKEFSRVIVDRMKAEGVLK
jgi:hypothetical protein